MKIKIDIDCTPQEARDFLGLPDVTPVHEAMVEAMRDRMQQVMQGADLETMMKSWFPVGMSGMEAVQKMFRDAATGKTGGRRE